MNLDTEEEIVVLFALHDCGGKGRKARIIWHIIENQLIKPREGDEELRHNHEKKVENDLAWARENLKERYELIMPQHGCWQITDKGTSRLLKLARAVHDRNPTHEMFARFSQKLLVLLNKLGARTE